MMFSGDLDVSDRASIKARRGKYGSISVNVWQDSGRLGSSDHQVARIRLSLKPTKAKELADSIYQSLGLDPKQEVTVNIQSPRLDPKILSQAIQEVLDRERQRTGHNAYVTPDARKEAV